MSTHHSVIATAGPVDSNAKIINVVRVHFSKYISSKKLAHQAFLRNEILHNGIAASEAARVHEGDTLELILTKESARVKYELHGVSVKYDSGDVAVIEKCAGVSLAALERSVPYLIEGFENIEETNSLEEHWEKEIEEKQDGIQYCVNYLNKRMVGLVVIGKSMLVCEDLKRAQAEMKMSFRYRTLVLGKVTGDSVTKLSRPSVPFLTTLIKVTRSTSAPDGYISTLDIQTSGLGSSRDGNISAIPLIKDALLKAGYPIVGLTAGAGKILKSGRDKGLFMALCEVTFEAPGKREKEEIKVEIKEPQKFEVFRQREERFFEKKVRAEKVELETYGVTREEIINEDVPTWKRTPVAYLTGRKKFWGREFAVSPDAMIPRRNTEILVRVCLDIVRNDEIREWNVLDVGTGTGCILCAVVKSVREKAWETPLYDGDDQDDNITEQNGDNESFYEINSPILQHKRTLAPSLRSSSVLSAITGIGIDVSPAVLSLASSNASSFSLTDLIFSEISLSAIHLATSLHHAHINLIVCNPPYLDASRPVTDRRIHEPAEALYATNKGYAAYEELMESLRLCIKGINESEVLDYKGCWLVLECGAGMANKVKTIVESSGYFKWFKGFKDPQGLERALLFAWEGINQYSDSGEKI